MATSTPAPAELSWRDGLAAAAVLAAALFYVVVYGGPLSSLGLLALWTVSIAVGLFVLSLLYRFVVAVERIADRL